MSKISELEFIKHSIRGGFQALVKEDIKKLYCPQFSESEFRALVVLVNFPDKSMDKSKRHFEDLFFSDGFFDGGSVKEYYRELSQGRINLYGQVIGPYLLPTSIFHYANDNSGISFIEPNARSLAIDLVKCIKDYVHFSPYDYNQDGYVDALIIIHAGLGAEESGSSQDLRSHKWTLTHEYLPDSKTKIFSYIMLPENCTTTFCATALYQFLLESEDPESKE